MVNVIEVVVCMIGYVFNGWVVDLCLCGCNKLLVGGVFFFVVVW